MSPKSWNSKLWQPGIDSNTQNGRRNRGVVILAQEIVRNYKFGRNTCTSREDGVWSKHLGAGSPGLASENLCGSPLGKDCPVAESPALVPGRMRGSVLTADKKKTKKGRKKGGKKLVGVGGSKGRSVLTFESKLSNGILSADMEPRERVQILLREFGKKLTNSQSGANSWEVLAQFKHKYRDMLTRMVLNRSKFGAIPGIDVGDIFPNRAALSLVGLHCKSQAGIDYVEDTDPQDGRRMIVGTSVVVAGVYEDDFDEGDVLTYTGEGGNDLTGTRKQIQDQKLEGGNLALLHSYKRGISVRVIRARPDLSSSSAGNIYSYDGLYKVVHCACVEGLSKFKIYKYKLIRENNQPPLKWFRR